MPRKPNDKNIRDVYDSIASGWYYLRQKSVTDLSAFANEWKPGLLLDIGCGIGAYLKDFEKNGFKCFVMDLSNKQLHWAKYYKNKFGLSYPLVQGNCVDLPFKSNVFDYALAVAVIHHLDSAKKRAKAIAEMKRILKKGGTGLITVWNKDQPRFANSKKDVLVPWKHKGKEYYRYYHLFNKKELEKLTKKSGFNLVKTIEEKDKFGIKRNIRAVVKKAI